VRLGYSKELAAEPDEASRAALFEKLVAKLYEVGKATEAAAHLEIDAVIDPADTRAAVREALTGALGAQRRR
jgi:acetyl-CoA carboxylase carboxyltransferase component